MALLIYDTKIFTYLMDTLSTSLADPPALRIMKAKGQDIQEFFLAKWVIEIDYIFIFLNSEQKFIIHPV